MWWLNSHAFLYISNLTSLGMCQIAYVYMDGVKFSLFQNFAGVFKSIQVILQLFFSALKSDVCCLKIPLLLGEKDMLYVYNKVSVFIFGGVLGFKATRFLVNSIFFLDLQKVQEIIKNTIK